MGSDEEIASSQPALGLPDNAPGPAPAAREEFTGESIRMLELRHRMKNMLGIVQAVAGQTLRSASSLEEGRKALEGRLTAMGHAVDMLLESAWSATDLEALVRLALVHGGTRVSVSGPPLTVGADAAMALNLVFHELESNAIKYGALAGSEGAVDVRWSVVSDRGDDWLHLEWRERDGPACEPPSRQGFGSRMIARLVGGRFKGTAHSEYLPDGLRWRLSAAVAALAL
jgi:two-component sensor histidine kinase